MNNKINGFLFGFLVKTGIRLHSNSRRTKLCAEHALVYILLLTSLSAWSQNLYPGVSNASVQKEVNSKTKGASRPEPIGFYRCLSETYFDQQSNRRWLEPKEFQHLQKLYEKQIRLGCIDISMRAIQEIPPPRLVRKYLNPPQSFEKYERRCDFVMTAISQEMRKISPDYSAIQAQIEEYRDNCANKFFSNAKPGFDVVADRLGVLAMRDSLAIYCTASLLGPNYIKTALHCLERPGQGGVMTLKEIIFSPYTKPSRTIGVTEAYYPPGVNVENYLSNHSRETKDAKNDYVVLKLAEPVQMSINAEYQLGTVEDIDKYLVIPGFNSLIAYRGITGSYEMFKKVFSNWTEFIYWDGSGGCILDRVESDVCLIHSCQTIYGQSGAPVFGYDTDNLRVIDLGVHSGGLNDASCRPRNYAPNRPPAYTRAAPNLANALNIKWISKFGGNKEGVNAK